MLFNLVIWGWFLISALFVTSVALGDDEDEQKRPAKLAVALLWPLAMLAVLAVIFVELIDSFISTTPKDPDSV